MSLNFEKYAMKGNEFLNALARNLGDETDKRRAARVLRSVLHVLRDHLTVEESVQLMAQLPMAIKSIYISEWNARQSDRKARHLEDFAIEVVKQDGGFAWEDYQCNRDVECSIRAVIQTLGMYVSKNELEQAFGTLPKELKETFTSYIYHWPAERALYTPNNANHAITNKSFEFFY